MIQDVYIPRQSIEKILVKHEGEGKSRVHVHFLGEWIVFKTDGAGVEELESIFMPDFYALKISKRKKGERFEIVKFSVI